MTLALDFPQSRTSFLGRLDPRWKLAALVPAAVLIGLLRDWRLSAVALCLALVLVAAAWLPPRWYLARMLGLTFFLLLFLAWPVFFPGAGEAIWDLGWAQLSLPRLRHLAGVLSRALAMVSLVLVLLATAPMSDNLKAAHALRVPGLLIQLLMLTHRYLHLLGEEFRRLRTALRVRGFRNRARWHSYRTIGQVAGTMLVRSYERAERVGQAMRARGFDGSFRSVHEFHTRPRDVLFFVATLAAALSLILLNWLA